MPDKWSTGIRSLISRSSHIPQLDGVRGLAILMVLLVHAWSLSGSPAVTVGASQLDITFLFHSSAAGLELFFVLSGYLLFSQYINRHMNEEPHPSYVSFMKRRLSRILPAYYALLFAVFFVIPSEGQLLRVDTLLGLANLATHLLLVNNFSSSFADSVPAVWALAVEVQFYLVLPFIAYLTLRGRLWRQRLFWGWLSSIVLYLVTVLASSWLSSPFHSLTFHLSEFMAGYVAAAVVVPMKKDPALQRRRRIISILCHFAGVTAIISLMYVGHLCAYNQLPISHTIQSCIGISLYPLTGAAFAILIVGAVTSTGFLKKMWSNRIIMYIGIVSYGMFLWHPYFEMNLTRSFVIGLISDTALRIITVFTAAVALSALAGHISFAFLESSFLTRSAHDNTNSCIPDNKK